MHSPVVSFYNQRAKVRNKREDSPIFYLRAYNNWVKVLLIQTYCREGFSVFDEAGGKGGDLLKWLKARIGHLVFIDISEESVKEAESRYKKLRTFPAIFMTLDLTKDIRRQLDDLGIDFDLVSCQFALHYSFETEDKARNFVRNAAYRLKPGGFFIGTIPDANWIVYHLRKYGPKFGNDLYTIRFESKNLTKFGARYEFFLRDAIENVPEYLVHFPTLIDICRDNGLNLVYQKRFPEFYLENKTEKNMKLMEKMRVFDENGSIPEDIWEIAGMYMAFAFRKGM